jgi:hypothetical protein
MNVEVFAEWLRCQGHQVLRTTSSFWYDQGPRVLQAIPYHWLIEPPEGELLQVLQKHQMVGLRYSTSLASSEGCVSYHGMFENPPYDLEILSKWSRKNVRRGLRNCTVAPISFRRLAGEGRALHLDTLDRQGRELELDQQMWRRRCLSAAELPGFEAWGALVDGILAASVITFQMEDCCYMLYQQCLRDYLREHVNNALSFVVTQTMIGRSAIRSIFYGLHSLDAPPSVDEFKFRMGYTAKPVRQRVVFHPWLRPLFNGATHGVLCGLRRWQPGNVTFAKAEGMIRFYREGARPLSEQQWPPALESRRDELLAWGEGRTTAP